MKNTLPWLCSLALTLCLSQMGNAQDFNVLEMPAQDAISFDVIAKSEQQLATEHISFAVLDCPKECDCETTGVCLCDDCQCPNCPNKKKDTRPLITVRTTKDCLPCKVLKKESQGEALSGFRFEFVEQEEVEDGAPQLEWKGADSRWALNGWYGVENFKRNYERSQQEIKKIVSNPIRLYTPAPRMHYRPMSYAPSFAPRSCSSCFGGACRTCR